METLATTFMRDHPSDAARVLERIDPIEVTGLLSDLDDPVAADVIEQLSADIAARCLESLPAARATSILAELPVAHAAILLRRLKPSNQADMLDHMPGDSDVPVRQLLAFREDTAGALLDPFAFTLSDDITIDEARERIALDPDRVRHYLYIVNRDRKLVGVLNLRQFMLAGSEDRVSAVMTPSVTAIRAETPIAQIRMRPEWMRFLSLPVVDDEGRFLGVLTTKTVQTAESAPRTNGPPATLMKAALTLGEMYWTGMGRLITGALPASTRTVSKEERSR